MILFKQYTLTAGAVALSDATILNIIGVNTKAFYLRVRNATGAANPIYLGPSTVTNVPANAGLQAAAGETIELGPLDIYTFDLKEIFIVGTVAGANIAFITAIL